MDKDLIKSLIQLKQRELPLDLIKRDNPLPIDSQKIVVVPGFIKTKRGVPVSLIQVCWKLSDSDTKDREIRGLSEAMDATGCTEMIIITHEEENQFDLGDNKIKVIPAWKFFLN